MAEERQRGYTHESIGEVKEEESDDFIIIQVDECSSTSSNTPCSSVNTSNSSPSVKSKTEKTNDISSVDSGFDFEDYVEVSYDDVQTEDGQRSEEQKRSLYGVRLFQYSPESEGNIYITNEEL